MSNSIVGTDPKPFPAKTKSALGSRAFWLRQMRQWHWISAAISLIGMLLFAVTGITLNHAASIEAKPVVSERVATLPAALKSVVGALPAKGKVAMPAPIADWASVVLKIDISGREAEISESEIYVALPRPGGDAWLAIERRSGEARYELTSRGWISYLNDLHKGRNTGAMWSLFLDVFAIACVVFCLTGLVLLQLLSNGRPSTWPLVGLGFAIPMLVAIFFIH